MASEIKSMMGRMGIQLFAFGTHKRLINHWVVLG
jgi:hypothetical protein